MDEVDWKEIAAAASDFNKKVLEKVKEDGDTWELTKEITQTQEEMRIVTGAINKAKQNKPLGTQNAALAQIAATEIIIKSAKKIGLNGTFMKANLPKALLSEKNLKVLKNAKAFQIIELRTPD